MSATGSIHRDERTPAPPAPVSPRRPRRWRLRSQLLGEIFVAEDAILEFPDGLFGFSSSTHWILVQAGPPGCCWLHALDHPALAFLLVDPFDAYPDFSVTLTAHDLVALGVSSAADVGVYAIVTLPRTAAESMTVNLQGPVAIAAKSRRGRQLLLGDVRLGDARFGARAPFTPRFAADAQVLRRPTDTEA